MATTPEKVPYSHLRVCRGGCNNLLRPPRTTKEEYPGTVAIRRNGYCAKCARTNYTPGKRPDTPAERERLRRLNLLPPRPEGLNPHHLQIRRDIEKIITNRRARGIPAEGLDPVVWAQQREVQGDYRLAS